MRETLLYIQPAPEYKVTKKQTEREKQRERESAQRKIYTHLFFKDLNTLDCDMPDAENHLKYREKWRKKNQDSTSNHISAE